eukprot:scaffold26245_cov57-Phaeocystis_antarctica.AAC.1
MLASSMTKASRKRWSWIRYRASTPSATVPAASSLVNLCSTTASHLAPASARSSSVKRMAAILLCADTARVLIRTSGCTPDH